MLKDGGLHPVITQARGRGVPTVLTVPRTVPGTQQLLYAGMPNAKESKIIFTCFLVSSLFRVPGSI